MSRQQHFEPVGRQTAPAAAPTSNWPFSIGVDQFRQCLNSAPQWRSSRMSSSAVEALSSRCVGSRSSLGYFQTVFASFAAEGWRHQVQPKTASCWRRCFFHKCSRFHQLWISVMNKMTGDDWRIVFFFPLPFVFSGLFLPSSFLPLSHNLHFFLWRIGRIVSQHNIFIRAMSGRAKYNLLPILMNLCLKSVLWWIKLWTITSNEAAGPYWCISVLGCWVLQSYLVARGNPRWKVLLSSLLRWM